MPEETDVIQHRIKLTDDTPIQCKPYPSPYATREELRHEVDSMLEIGVVCVDFRKLNKITEVDPEPMTTSEDLFCLLSDKKYLSKINLTKQYWLIPVAPEDVYKTVFVTPEGQYE